MSITFDLGLALDKKLVLNSAPERKESLSDVLKGKYGDLEQTSSGEIVPGTANIVGLAHECFSSHRHMILDPDSIWSTIESGLAMHINKNAEELRSKFVTFQGKVTIEIRRDHFVRGGKNDWEGCFDEFSEKIGEYIGPKKDLIVGKFTTTGIIQRVSSEIILMNAMKEYFNYLCTTCCSIPVVSLLGEVQDWENILDRVRKFDEFGLSWWTGELIPVLEELIKTAKGDINLDFWRSWYKEGGGSGGPFITGHVIKFFPYIGTELVKNTFGFSKRGLGGGTTLSDFPIGTNAVPFVWSYYSTQYPMEFIGGILGLEQREDGALRCGFGWGVHDECVPFRSYPMERLYKDMVVHHKKLGRGVLKRVDIETFADGSRKIDFVIVDWDNGGEKKHEFYDISGMYIKESFECQE